MRKLLREPLLHFLVLGALLFGLYGLLHARNGAPAGNEIVVSAGQVRSLLAQFERTWQRPATPDELQGLVDGWIRDEIFYREGLALGLDRDDPVVRRRIAQKLEFIVDGPSPAAPTQAELQAWLAAHASKYQIEARYTLRQLYFDVTRHGERLAADVEAARRALVAGKQAEGDATLLPPLLEDAGTSRVARTFGKEFATALQSLPAGAWQGPLRSAYGVHLVQVLASQPARNATLAEAGAEVERDLLQARAAEASAAQYAKLRARYTVRADRMEDARF